MKAIKLTTICLLAIAAIACQKQSRPTPLTIEPSSVFLYYDGKQQLTANPAEGVTYSSEDEYYAEVDANGLVTGNKVGETNIVASSSNGTVTIPVTVVPQYTLYPELEPIVNASLSEMTSILGTSFRKSSDDGKNTYTYKEYNNYTTAIVATFINGTCTEIGAIVPTTYVTKLTKYLKERYTVAGMQNDYFFFLNHDKTVMIAMAIYNARYMLAIYMPFTETKSDEIDDINTILESYRGLEVM